MSQNDTYYMASCLVIGRQFPFMYFRFVYRDVIGAASLRNSFTSLRDVDQNCVRRVKKLTARGRGF